MISRFVLSAVVALISGPIEAGRLELFEWDVPEGVLPGPVAGPGSDPLRSQIPK